MYTKILVSGKFLYETDTHYVTQLGEEVISWNKEWYYLEPEWREVMYGRRKMVL